MLHADYIQTVETKLAWLRHGQDAGGALQREYGRIVETYLEILEASDTFYMNGPFCDLVDAARREIPANTPFNAQWLQAKRGWLWCATPFEVPPVVEQERDFVMRVRGVGWREVPPDSWLVAYDGSKEVAPPGCVQFCFFIDQAYYHPLAVGAEPTPPWSPWSFFVLRDGQLLHERMMDFEERGRLEQGTFGEYAVNKAAAYVTTGERVIHPLHEMRWLYAALFVMAQKLAITVNHPVDRATRRRAEKAGEKIEPIIRVITLRRLEQEREANHVPADVDWQCRWIVRPHWRQQYYPSENVHRPILIASFIKGPADKPLKPETLKLFVAGR